MLGQGVPVRYAFIQAHEGQFTIKPMCRVLRVSRSGYYAWQQAPESRRTAEIRRLEAAIQRRFDDQRGRYGAPRITLDLRAEGWRVSRRRVARRRRAMGLRARAARRFKATTQSKHTLPVAPNRRQRDFTAAGPNPQWVADITYLWTAEGWLYLAVCWICTRGPWWGGPWGNGSPGTW